MPLICSINIKNKPCPSFIKNKHLNDSKYLGTLWSAAVFTLRDAASVLSVSSRGCFGCAGLDWVSRIRWTLPTGQLFTDTDRHQPALFFFSFWGGWVFLFFYTVNSSGLCDCELVWALFGLSLRELNLCCLLQ